MEPPVIVAVARVLTATPPPTPAALPVMVLADKASTEKMAAMPR